MTDDADIDAGRMGAGDQVAALCRCFNEARTSLEAMILTINELPLGLDLAPLEALIEDARLETWSFADDIDDYVTLYRERQV